MKGKLGLGRTLMGVGAVAMGLLGAGLFPHHAANGQERASTPKDKNESAGIAAIYPGDVGIERDSNVLFHDDFETDLPGKLWDMTSRGSADGPVVAAETDQAIVRGTRSARATLNKGGREDITLAKQLPPGYDELYMRHYVRYGNDYGYHSRGGSGFMADAGKGQFKGADQDHGGTSGWYQ